MLFDVRVIARHTSQPRSRKEMVRLSPDEKWDGGTKPSLVKKMIRLGYGFCCLSLTRKVRDFCDAMLSYKCQDTRTRATGRSRLTSRALGVSQVQFFSQECTPSWRNSRRPPSSPSSPATSPSASSPGPRGAFEDIWWPAFRQGGEQQSCDSAVISAHSAVIPGTRGRRAS